MKEDGSALIDCPVTSLNDQQLRNFIEDVRNMEEENRADPGEQELADEWASRLQDLKYEANSRGVSYSDTNHSENSYGNQSENGQ